MLASCGIKSTYAYEGEGQLLTVLRTKDNPCACHFNGESIAGWTAHSGSATPVIKPEYTIDGQPYSILIDGSVANNGADYVYENPIDITAICEVNYYKLCLFSLVTGKIALEFQSDDGTTQGQHSVTKKVVAGSKNCIEFNLQDYIDNGVDFTNIKKINVLAKSALGDVWLQKGSFYTNELDMGKEVPVCAGCTGSIDVEFENDKKELECAEGTQAIIFKPRKMTFSAEMKVFRPKVLASIGGGTLEDGANLIKQETLTVSKTPNADGCYTATLTNGGTLIYDEDLYSLFVVDDCGDTFDISCDPNDIGLNEVYIDSLNGELLFNEANNGKEFKVKYFYYLATGKSYTITGRNETNELSFYMNLRGSNKETSNLFIPRVVTNITGFSFADPTDDDFATWEFEGEALYSEKIDGLAKLNFPS